MGFTVREGRSGDHGAGHKPAGRAKKSNWDLMGSGKGKGKEKQDLDEKGQGKAGGWKEKSGGKKGIEKKVKKGAY